MDPNAKVLEQEPCESFVRDKIARVRFSKRFTIELNVETGSDIVDEGFDLGEVLDRVNYYQQFEKFEVCLCKKDGSSDVKFYDFKVGTFKMVVSDDVTRVEIALTKRSSTVTRERDTDCEGGYDTN
jgi:hypothetical protein